MPPGRVRGFIQCFPKKTISILVPEDLYQELSVLAAGASRPLSAYIRQILKAHLQYLERFQRDKG